MSEILKVFLGTNGRIGDSPELKRLGIESKEKEGFQLFLTAYDMIQELEILPEVRKVKVRGGRPDACVASAINYFLRIGLSVGVDMPYIRTDFDEELNRNPDLLAKVIVRGLDEDVDISKLTLIFTDKICSVRKS